MPTILFHLPCSNCMKKSTQAHLALLGANLLYGAGFSVAKSIMPRLIQAQGFILIRVSVTAVLFWLSYFLGKDYQGSIHKKDWPRLILCAATGIAINQLLFFAGLSHTSPIHASLMMLCTPLLVLVMAALLLKEKISGKRLLGIALGVIGALLLITLRSTEQTGSNVLLGDILIFINAASYAVYLVIVKPLMHNYRPIIVIRWIFLLGFFMVLPFGFTQVQQVQWHVFGAKEWCAVVFIILGITFFTYLWNIFALRILSPTIAGAYIYLQPLFAGTISILFLGEALTWAKALSAMCIFVGVALANGLIGNNEETRLHK
jgi:drug/metabolite transporter (DMT)-like permease